MRIYGLQDGNELPDDPDDTELMKLIRTYDINGDRHIHKE